MADLEETVKVEETDKEQSKKPKEVKKPRKPRRSALEPRVSTPEPMPSPKAVSPLPTADRNAELEAKLASMWGAGKETNIFENRNPSPIVVQSPQKQAGRACSLCKERFENLKELGNHIEKVHKPARGRGSPRVQSPLEMARSSSPSLGRKRAQDKKKNVFALN